MKMSKRFLALFLALSLLIVGGATSALAVTSETEGEVTIWLRRDPEGAGAVNGLDGSEPGAPYYEYFQEELPNIKINVVVNKGWGELVNAIAAGDAPDLFFWEGQIPNGLINIVGQSLAEPLDDYIANDPDFVNNFIPAIFEGHKLDGKLYALPFDVMPYGIMANLDVFDKTNTPYPSADWTIDDFIATAKSLTNKSDPTNKTVGVARNIDEQDYIRILSMFFVAYGVKGYTEVDGVRVSNLADDPNAFDAIEKYLEVQGNNYACTFTKEERDALGLDNDIWDIDWSAGVAGTFPGVSSWAIQTDPAGGLKFPQAFYPAPSGPAGAGADLNVISYSMYAGSKNKEAAWEVLKAITSEAFRQNAYSLNEAGEKVYPFRYDENMAKFAGYGIAPFDSEYKLSDTLQPLYDGFRDAANNAILVPMQADKMVELTRAVDKGEKQLADALKEYDEWVNANAPHIFDHAK